MRMRESDNIWSLKVWPLNKPSSFFSFSNVSLITKQLGDTLNHIFPRYVLQDLLLICRSKWRPRSGSPNRSVIRQQEDFSVTRRLLLFTVTLILSFRAHLPRTKGEVETFWWQAEQVQRSLGHHFVPSAAFVFFSGVSPCFVSKPIYLKLKVFCQFYRQNMHLRNIQLFSISYEKYWSFFLLLFMIFKGH